MTHHAKWTAGDCLTEGDTFAAYQKLCRVGGKAENTGCRKCTFAANPSSRCGHTPNCGGSYFVEVKPDDEPDLYSLLRLKGEIS